MTDRIDSSLPLVTEDALRAAAEASYQKQDHGLDSEEQARQIDELVNFCLRNRPALERSFEALVRLSSDGGSAEGQSGAAYVSRLEHALSEARRGEPDPATVRALLEHDAFRAVTDSLDQTDAFAATIGLSGKYDKFLGIEIGAEFGWVPIDEIVFLRGYGFLALGLDLDWGFGLNIGLWGTLPDFDDVVPIGGIFVDYPFTGTLPGWLPGDLFFRLTPVRIASKFIDPPSQFTLSGVVVSANLGRITAVPYPPEVLLSGLETPTPPSGSGIAGYRGAEYLLRLKLRSSLTVTNCTDGTDPCEPGTDTIEQNVSSVLKCSLENTSGNDATIPSGSKIVLTLPSFFSATEASASTVSPPTPDGVSADDWTCSWHNSVLTMTYNGTDDITWSHNDSLVTELSGLSSSENGPQTGVVTVSVPAADFGGQIIPYNGTVSTATLKLEEQIQKSTITEWEISFDSTFQLVEGCPTSGDNVDAYSQSSRRKVVTLTQLTNSQGTWDLGYQYYYDSSKGQWDFYACWSLDGSTQVNGRTWYPDTAASPTTTPQTSTAYYGGNKTDNTNCIQITFELASDDTSTGPASTDDESSDD